MSVAADRGRREIRRPVTYWEEFVQTNPWYAEEMLRDVPLSEMKAALEDSDYSCSGERLQ
jgi:hypothetical protein